LNTWINWNRDERKGNNEFWPEHLFAIHRFRPAGL
jgi:hypothetical protein